MPKPPLNFLIDSFDYKYLTGKKDKWQKPEYSEPMTINFCRIDRGPSYSSSSSGKQLLYNALIFCYEGLTDPLPEFKVESIIHFDGQDHTVTRVIPVYEAYSKTIYAYEIEVV
ncbi:minor capsid protein [Alkalicoccobacillus porphyridii]|uniref:Minor capsid protein n=2 Tax=Alkalicoccobacillus porphyridii TaxID=2597270 RepID=A0A554A0F6_9BACI|nr:minor capsid protein [Alkalicoccobacillus porphyridii]